jgi:hypothetical protein
MAPRTSLAPRAVLSPGRGLADMPSITDDDSMLQRTRLEK